MFSRLATSLSSATRLLSTTSALRMPKPYTPADWRIIETSPSGLERTFTNDKTGEETWYTPDGMTASEILKIPGAKKYWKNESDVQKYIKEMAAEKARSDGQDINDP
ncbi:hypothetical protein CPB83DRAFT_903985 [Crepidotus variabilis]|uniref:Uncharacterized protein n=1 Tax=Crepidotus variabilis TaxID=179855 RepID=A0A9P6EMZ7_9AGAR|nr:hypothetical protein CPB83DRAFT_903985 [Crepidotus variabilis]